MRRRLVTRAATASEEQGQRHDPDLGGDQSIDRRPGRGPGRHQCQEGASSSAGPRPGERSSGQAVSAPTAAVPSRAHTSAASSPAPPATSGYAGARGPCSPGRSVSVTTTVAAAPSTTAGAERHRRTGQVGTRGSRADDASPGGGRLA